VDFEVTAQRIEDYAAAIGDANPRFRRQGRDGSAMVAPPAMAAAYLQEPVRRLFADDAVISRLGVRRDRVVFGEVEYRYAELVRPDDWLRVDGELVDDRRAGDKRILTFTTAAHRADGARVAAATIVVIER
jgi:hypothetical protein